MKEQRKKIEENLQLFFESAADRVIPSDADIAFIRQADNKDFFYQINLAHVYFQKLTNAKYELEEKVNVSPELRVLILQLIDYAIEEEREKLSNLIGTLTQREQEK